MFNYENCFNYVLKNTLINFFEDDAKSHMPPMIRK